MITRVLLWSGLLLVPSIVTVLRYTGSLLNADGVEQSVMSIQGVKLFYWGQDRLFPAVSLLASPIADPTANLWVCLVLQALSFYGLLLLVAHRTAAALADNRRITLGATHLVLVSYLTLVVTANCLLSPEAIHRLSIEGQPYALSFLLVGLSYEAWKRGGALFYVAAAVGAFVALGVNPSAVLLAGFLALMAAVRDRRFLRWVAYLATLAVFFVAWTLLSGEFGMYPSPEHTPPPSYLGFTVAEFRGGFFVSISNVLSALRPVRTVVVVLLAIAATVSLGPESRARLLRYGAHCAWFTVLYVSLFAGNEWVRLNGYHFRYFFPLQLLLLMAVAVPIAAGLGELHGRAIASARVRPHAGRLAVGLVVAVAVGALVASAGAMRMPQDARVFRASARTESYAVKHDVRFISGAYWNMWPLMHGLLAGGRHAVYVAGEKSAGDPEEYDRVVSDELAHSGKAEALCVNQSVDSCTSYLDAWTRPGWKRLRPGGSCPAPPILGPVGAEGTNKPRCRVLVLRDNA